MTTESNLTKVQETLFFPLLGRAEATARWSKLFSDPWARQAQRIANAENTSATGLGHFPCAVYGLRHHGCVADIKEYLRDHPQAAVVNIGCGLDRLEEDLSDVSHGPIYNLDFPEVIELRQRWLPQADSIDLAYSATDAQWMDHVDASGGCVAVAAGVMYYLEVQDAARMVRAMSQRFPGGRFIYDAESPKVTAESEKQIAASGVEASMPFKVKDPRVVGQWAHRDGLAEPDVEIRWNFSHSLAPAQRRGLPWKVRAIFKVMELIRGMYVVKVTFPAA